MARPVSLLVRAAGRAAPVSAGTDVDSEPRSVLCLGSLAAARIGLQDTGRLWLAGHRGEPWRGVMGSAPRLPRLKGGPLALQASWELSECLCSEHGSRCHDTTVPLLR